MIRANGVSPVIREVFTNTSVALDSNPNTQRYFVYTSGSVATQFEVGGTWDEALLRTTTTSNTFETTGGTLYDQTVTTTEPASGANGISAGGSWVTRTKFPLANLVNDLNTWCLGRPGRIEDTRSHTLIYGSGYTRTTDVVWNATFCRPTHHYVELGSPLQVTTEFGYDSFGNVIGQQVTGYAMTTRSSTAVYYDGSNATGQFPLSMTNALNQTSTLTWNYDLGVPNSTADANGISTSWVYDAFGRRVRENHPDGTYTTWDLLPCPGCDPRARTYLEQNERDSGGTSFTRSIRLLDQFDRQITEYGLRTDGAFNISTRNFDLLGRVVNEYFPYTYATGNFGSSTIAYDLIGRPAAISRPISDGNASLQTTDIFYEGLTTRIRDANSKLTYRVMNAAGQIARSQDHDGYYQGFEYDAFGGVKRVRDSASNDLQTSIYNVRGMLTSRTDLDMGTWTFSPNALGEVDSQLDAKGQPTSFEYDLLGRLKKRTEAEGISHVDMGRARRQHREQQICRAAQGRFRARVLRKLHLRLGGPSVEHQDLCRYRLLHRLRLQLHWRAGFG